MRSSRAERVPSFPPILGARPRILVLGSLPGIASLQAGEYYAHPRNQFWPIMAALCGFAPEAPYAARTAALRAAGVCVWDVLAEAARPGSADADIDAATARAHDVRGLLVRQRSISLLAFNGAAAQRHFARLVLPALPGQRRSDIRFVTLPSTSPAHATLGPAGKLRRWRAALGGVLPQRARPP